MRRPARLGLALALIWSGAGAEDMIANRPAFSAAEQPARASAHCDEIRTQSAEMSEPEDRIDLSMVGELTLVKTDGALWYLLMCRDVRVLCVTYESNDMKAGDRVVMKGAYSRRDENHIMLDPCLAHRADQPGDGDKCSLRRGCRAASMPRGDAGCRR